MTNKILYTIQKIYIEKKYRHIIVLEIIENNKKYYSIGNNIWNANITMEMPIFKEYTVSFV
mgnify:CR=1 FL=1